MEKKYAIEDGEHLTDIIVSWIITHACQEKCAYCISPCMKQEVSKEEKFKIQQHMIETGLTKNRYIGGEPLLIPYLGELIHEAHVQGLNTRLSTNGILLTPERFNEIKNDLNSFAFPFESCNDELNEKIRGSRNHRELVTSRIKMVKDYDESIGVLVNTCVHKENLDELVELGGYLRELGVDHWKLRKFNSSSGRGAVINKNRFEISDEAFNNLVNKVKKLYPDFRIDGRMPSKLRTRLMVSPQGNLYRMGDNDDNNVEYGNVLQKKLNIKDIYIRDKCN